MDYQKTIEAVPTWALCYIINGDSEGISEEEAAEINQWLTDFKIDIVSPINDSEGNWSPYFKAYPIFGKGAEVVDGNILMRK